MAERTRVRIVACAGVLLAWMAGAACTGTHGMSAGPKGSTETGNPPVLDSNAVSLVVSQDAVHVVGEPGAVTPPEGTVEITVLRTGEKITGTVNADGSFDVRVDGTLDDVFEVRVVQGGRSSMTVTVTRGGARVGPGDGGKTMEPPSAQCDELDMRMVNGAMMVAASAQTACETDDDCGILQMPSGCGHAYSCDIRYVARPLESGLEAALVQVEEIACADFETLGCVAKPGCNVDPVEPACIAGRCAAKGSPDHCADCDDFELSWTVINAGTLPADITGETYTINGCGTLTTRSHEGRTICSRELPACGASGSRWKKELDVLLADDDITRVTLENQPPRQEDEEFSGFVYEFTIQGKTFTFRDCAGQPGRDCRAAAGIRELIAYLWDLRIAHGCNVNEDCTSPFDPGSGGSTIGVYWHDPASRTCLPRSYRGSGGNSNRYRTIEECQERCPPPASSDDCGPDRVFAADQCLACGLAGGCRAQSNRCLLGCESAADCEGEENGEVHSLSCTDGVCTVALFCI